MSPVQVMVMSLSHFFIDTPSITEIVRLGSTNNWGAVVVIPDTAKLMSISGYNYSSAPGTLREFDLAINFSSPIERGDIKNSFFMPRDSLFNKSLFYVAHKKQVYISTIHTGGAPTGVTVSFFE